MLYIRIAKRQPYTEKTKAEKVYVTLKLEKFTVSVRVFWLQKKTKQAKVNISVCSLKREFKLKVTKFCIGWKELINAYKPTT